MVKDSSENAGDIFLICRSMRQCMAHRAVQILTPLFHELARTSILLEFIFAFRWVKGHFHPLYPNNHNREVGSY